MESRVRMELFAPSHAVPFFWFWNQKYLPTTTAAEDFLCSHWCVQSGV
jgi:hypothetical protein